MEPASPTTPADVQLVTLARRATLSTTSDRVKSILVAGEMRVPYWEGPTSVPATVLVHLCACLYVSDIIVFCVNVCE